MKSKNRIDYGFSGFHVAKIPKAPRSIRRRAELKNADEDICAFELLASLAKKLLQESESSSACSNASGNDHVTTGKHVIKDGHDYELKPLKRECPDQGSSKLSAVLSESGSQNCDQKCTLNEFSLAEDDDIMERTSKIMDLGFSGKNGGDLKSASFKSNSANKNIPRKVEEEGDSLNFGESCNAGMKNRFEKGLETIDSKTGVIYMDKKCRLSDPKELGVTYPALIKSDNDVKLPSCRVSVPYASFSRQRNDLKLGVRNDDDNLVRNNKFSNKVKGYRPMTRVGDRRLRKLLTSRYWKVAPKLKDFELSRADGGIKPLHCKRKTCQSHERCQHDAFYKRRKFHNQSTLETFDGGFSCESVTNSPEKNRKGDKMFPGASDVASSVVGHQGSIVSKGSNVKFSIKSFRVPEILIEVSETATVASLKRTVMDTVAAILGGGIRIGVHLHGKKIRDDNRTLFQSGISSADNLNSMGFTLEPSSVVAPSPVCSGDPPLLLPCNTPQVVPRSPVTPALDSGVPNSLADPSPMTNGSNRVETNHEAIACHTDVLTDTTVTDSRALVPVPALNVNALAVVPVNQKSKRSEIAQRRTRRPFSVSEVEALVQAVEELGTGRWRDVKLRSFELAEHRTYVDLKDKWKTLVHTAKISPQQRRGEPVPQTLLDRVLAAHAYWSMHQAKQQGKHQTGILKIEAQQVERNGVAGV